MQRRLVISVAAARDIEAMSKFSACSDLVSFATANGEVGDFITRNALKVANLDV